MNPLPERLWIAGCGFVGHALALELSRQGCEVLGLTHSEDSARLLQASAPYRVTACDISDAATVAALAEREAAPAAVVHCASSGRGGVEQYRAVYLDGCRHFAGRFPSAHLLFTSSTSVYPQTEGETVTESTPARPTRETGQVLREAEEVVLGNRGTVARLAGLYGPGRSVLLQRFFDGTARIETGTSRFLNQVHRDDVVSALVLLLRHPETSRGAIFNVSDGSALTQRACYEELAAHFGTPCPAEAPPDFDRKRGWTHKHILPVRLAALGWKLRFPGFLDAVRDDPDFVTSIRALASLPRASRDAP